MAVKRQIGGKDGQGRFALGVAGAVHHRLKDGVHAEHPHHAAVFQHGHMAKTLLAHTAHDLQHQRLRGGHQHLGHRGHDAAHPRGVFQLVQDLLQHLLHGVAGGDGVLPLQLGLVAEQVAHLAAIVQPVPIGGKARVTAQPQHHIAVSVVGADQVLRHRLQPAPGVQKQLGFFVRHKWPSYLSFMFNRATALIKSRTMAALCIFGGQPQKAQTVTMYTPSG